MKETNIYTLSSKGIIVKFTVDNIRKEDRERLANELAALNDHNREDSLLFMERHILVGSVFEALAKEYPTVGQLAQVSDKELLSKRSFGRMRLKYLRDALWSDKQK